MASISINLKALNSSKGDSVPDGRRGKKRKRSPSTEVLDSLLRPRKAPLSGPSILPPRTPAQRATPSLEDEEVELFTDGSRLSDGMGGCGVAYFERAGSDWAGRAVALGRVQSSTAAELYGMLEGFTMAAEGYFGFAKKFVLWTDAQSIIDTIRRARSRKQSPDHIVELILAQDKLLEAREVKVTIKWVKSHGSSTGNCVADMLAGAGSRASQDGARAGSWWDDVEGDMFEEAKKEASEALREQVRRVAERAKRKALKRPAIDTNAMSQFGIQPPRHSARLTGS